MTEALEDIPNCPLHPSSKRLLCKECCWDVVQCACKDERNRLTAKLTKYRDNLPIGFLRPDESFIDNLDKVIEYFTEQKENLIMNRIKLGLSESGIAFEEILEDIHGKFDNVEWHELIPRIIADSIKQAKQETREETEDSLFAEIIEIYNACNDERPYEIQNRLRELAKKLDSLKLSIGQVTDRRHLPEQKECQRILKIIDDRRQELQDVYDNMIDKNTEFSIVHINCIHGMEDLIEKIKSLGTEKDQDKLRSKAEQGGKGNSLTECNDRLRESELELCHSGPTTPDVNPSAISKELFDISVRLRELSYAAEDSEK